MTDGARTPARDRSLLRRHGFHAVLVVAVLTAAVLGAVNFRHHHQQELERQAQAAAVSSVKQILSYDYGTLTTELRKERSLVTGDFGVEYPKLITGTIGPAARSGKVSTKAEISSRGIVSAEDGHVVVLLFVNITTVSPRLSEPRVAGSRVEVTMKKVDDSWKIADLEPV